MARTELALVSPVADARTVRVAVIGAGLAAGSTISAMAKVNRRSRDVSIKATVIDPRLGKAVQHAGALMRSGVVATGLEGSFADMPPSWLRAFDIIVVHDDRLGTTSKILKQTVDNPTNFISYSNVKFPDGALYTLAFAVTPADAASHLAVALLAAEIEDNTAPGSGGVFDGRNGVNAAAAALCRSIINEHHRGALHAMAVGMPLICHPCEVSVCGGPRLPLVIMQRPLGAGDPFVIAAKVAQDNPSILELGRAFVVAELIPGGMRFHETYIKADGTGVSVVKSRSVLRANLTGRLCVAG